MSAIAKNWKRLNIKRYNNNKYFKLWNFIPYFNIFTVINDFAKYQEYNDVKFLIQEYNTISNCSKLL